MHWDGGAKYNVIRVVGKGAFATVYLLADKINGDSIAAKELEKRRFMKNGILDFKVDNEIKIMKHLKHVRLITFQRRMFHHADRFQAKHCPVPRLCRTARPHLHLNGTCPLRRSGYFHA